MHDETLKRFTRQMVLPQIGLDGQQALMDAHVFIIGVGGLGSPAAMYLAAAGIGEITLVDYDRVDLSNLHRQILFDDSHIGQKKVTAASQRLQQVNPSLNINTIERKLTLDELLKYISDVDVVLDCSDNFTTRHLVNHACVKKQTALVSAAGIRLEGQIAVFNNRASSPCYACLYSDATDEAERCSEVGVLGPLVGIMGSMQALETIKLIAQVGEPLDGRLLIFDAETMQWRDLKLNKDPACAVCA